MLKTSEVFALAVLSGDNALLGVWSASARDLLRELQNSCSAVTGELVASLLSHSPVTCSSIAGTARIGVPDPDDPEYKKYFARLNGDEQPLELTVADSMVIPVPASCRMTLFIDEVCDWISSFNSINE